MAKIPKPKSKMDYNPIRTFFTALVLWTIISIFAVCEYLIIRTRQATNELPYFMPVFVPVFITIFVSLLLFFITIRHMGNFDWWKKRILIVLLLSLFSMHYLAFIFLFVYLISIYSFRRFHRYSPVQKTRLRNRVLKPLIIILALFLLFGISALSKEASKFDQKIELQGQISTAENKILEFHKQILIDGLPIQDYTDPVWPDCTDCQIERLRWQNKLLKATNNRLLQIMAQEPLPFPPAQEELNESLSFPEQLFVDGKINARIYLGVSKRSSFDEFAAAASLWKWLSEYGEVPEDNFQFIPINYPHKKLVYPLPSMNTIVIGNPCLNPAVSAIVFEGPPPNCLEDKDFSAVLAKKGKSWILSDPMLEPKLEKAVEMWMKGELEVSNQTCMMDNLEHKDCNILNI